MLSILRPVWSEAVSSYARYRRGQPQKATCAIFSVALSFFCHCEVNFNYGSLDLGELEEALSVGFYARWTGRVSRGNLYRSCSQLAQTPSSAYSWSSLVTRGLLQRIHGLR